MDGMLAEFLRGQMSVMLLMSIFYVSCLWLAGLEFALPIGVVAGMLVFVPYLGMFTGLALATLAAVTQFDQFRASRWCGVCSAPGSCWKAWWSRRGWWATASACIRWR